MNPLSPSRINTLLNEYLDGVLNDADRKSVEVLLAGDAAVRKELDRLKSMRGLLSQQKKIEPNPALWTRLAASLD